MIVKTDCETDGSFYSSTEEDTSYGVVVGGGDGDSKDYLDNSGEWTRVDPQNFDPYSEYGEDYIGSEERKKIVDEVTKTLISKINNQQKSEKKPKAKGKGKGKGKVKAKGKAKGKGKGGKKGKKGLKRKGQKKKQGQKNMQGQRKGQRKNKGLKNKPKPYKKSG